MKGKRPFSSSMMEEVFLSWEMFHVSVNSEISFENPEIEETDNEEESGINTQNIDRGTRRSNTEHSTYSCSHAQA